MIAARGSGSASARSAFCAASTSTSPRGGFAVVTGPNGSGKTTLLRICAGLALPSEGELAVAVQRAQVGYLAHDPLVYRELTALENLDLYGRLYRVPERRERIGMLLERFGLWDARADRVVVVLARDDAAARALPRAAARSRRCSILDEPYTALDAQGAELLDAQLAELARDADDPRRRRTTPRASTRSRPCASRSPHELLRRRRARSRARICCSSCAHATRCRRCCSSSSRRSSSSTSRCPPARRSVAASGLLWVAIVFTALLGLGRAFVPEREQHVLDGLVLAPCDRSAIWLAKSLATLAFLAAAEVVALPVFALFFHGLRGSTVAGVALADVGICTVGTLRRRDGRRHPGPRPAPAAALPAARHPDRRSAASARASSATPGRYLGFLALYDAVFALLCWAAFEYVVTE